MPHPTAAAMLAFIRAAGTQGMSFQDICNRLGPSGCGAELERLLRRGEIRHVGYIATPTKEPTKCRSTKRSR